MAALPVEDAWMETALVSISLLSGTEAKFQSLTETIDIDRGEKDTEGKPMVSGGRVTSWKPEGDTTVTLEVYPLESGTDSGTTGKGFMDLLHPPADTSQPLRITNNRTRTKARMIILWTNGVATSASAITLAGESGRRMGFANGHIVSVKDSFTDGILKSTVVFKTSAFNKAGDVGQIIDESVDGSGVAVLPAIAAYTSVATPFA